MSEWIEKPLSELAAIRVSNVDKKSHPNETPVRLCNYMDVYSGLYLNDEVEYMEATASVREIANFALQAGDVIITKDSESPDDIGIPAIIDQTAGGLVCGYHLAILRPDRSKVDPVFLLKQIEADAVRRYYLKRAAGSTRYGLATATIEATPIKVAPLESQRAISRILRAIDAQIAATEALIAKQELVRAGLMQDLFTRGVDEHGQLRPLRDQAPHLYHQTELGFLPKDWSVDSLASYAAEGNNSFTNGPFGSDLLSSELLSDGIPVIYVRDISQDEYNRVSTACVSQAKANQLAFCSVRKGDVLIAKVGDPPCMSASYLVDEQAIVTQDVMRLRPARLRDQDFLASFINSSFGAKLISRIVVEGTRSRVSLTEIKCLRVPVPNPRERDAIGAVASAALALVKSCHAELQRLRLQKSGLMQDLLTGKVSVAAMLEGAVA
jgi:type I restriction enzyme S subunit